MKVECGEKMYLLFLTREVMLSQGVLTVRTGFDALNATWVNGRREAYWLETCALDAGNLTRLGN